MRVAITGASGLVGHPIARWLAARGHGVTSLGRTPVAGLAHINWALNDAPPDLGAFDALVHAAFLHVPGRYRGGEGDDPDGFTRANLNGTLELWEAARAAGTHCVFLSSRAVYGDALAGTLLTEDRPPAPDTLYGRLKRAAEEDLGTQGVSLRVTGVYGTPPPGREHKWSALFAQYLEGETVAPRIGTEVASEDVARAVELVLDPRLGGEVFNVSDFVLDRRDLLQSYGALIGRTGPLPVRSEAARVNAMSTEKLRALGWTPMGRAHLPRVLRRLM